MSESEPIGLAILGAGIFAKEAHLPALSQSTLKPLVSLKAIYSRSYKSASEFVELANKELGLGGNGGGDKVRVYCDEEGREGIDDLLKRPDISAIIILLPIPLQPAFILKSLRAGKHVLSEKPVAPSVREGLELIRQAGEILSGKKGLVWRVAENFETEPGYQLASTLLSPTQPSKSPIGTPLSFTLSALNDLRPSSKYYQTPWRTHPAYQGGFLLDGGVHSAAVLRTVLPRGSRPVRVSGWSGLVREYLKPADWVRVEVELGDDDLLRQKEGDAKKKGDTTPKATGTFHLSFAAPSPTLSTHSNGFTIHGTEGWAEIRTVEVPEATAGLTGKAFSALKEAGRVPLPKADAPSTKDAALKTADAFVGGGEGEDQPRSTTLTKTKRVIRTTLHTNHPPKNAEGDEWGAGEWAGEEVRVYEEDEGGGVRVELGEFFKTIKGGKSDDIGDPMEALRDVALIEATLKSQGRVVDLLDLLRGGDGFGGKGEGKGKEAEFELEVFGSL